MMLIVFGGLPGTGKTTIAKRLAAKISAAYVRVDEIENALLDGATPGTNVGTAGYVVGCAVALSNLRIGNWVVADSVNPVFESRQAWRDVAMKANKAVLEIEMICSNESEHRRRVESREADISGFTLPTWNEVKARDYTAWTGSRLVIDSASLSPDDAVAKIEAGIAGLDFN